MLFDAFTSDLHFGHKNIIRFCDRPFLNVDDMTEKLIKLYNDKISHKDKVLFVGDIFFCSNKQAREILSQMNGEKYLVTGNHDAQPYDMISRGFIWTAEKLHVRWEHKNIVISHYDYWDLRSPYDHRYEEKRHPLNLNRMEVLIHGHTHQKTKRLLNQVHVGVDAWDYAPARYEEIVPLLNEVPSDWNSVLRSEKETLMEYAQNITNRTDVSDPKFDCFRNLGWERETVDRKY
jgi:calcineurin-like phosphoesterase family protein